MPDLEDLLFHLDKSFPKCLLDTLHNDAARTTLAWAPQPGGRNACRFLQSLPHLKIPWVNFELRPSFDDITILAAVSGSLDELCFPHGADTAEKGCWGLPDETDLLVQALRSHDIKPKRLLSPRLVGQDLSGRGVEIYVLSDMEENLRLNIALEAEVVEPTGYGIWGMKLQLAYNYINSRHHRDHLTLHTMEIPSDAHLPRPIGGNAMPKHNTTTFSTIRAEFVRSDSSHGHLDRFQPIVFT